MIGLDLSMAVQDIANSRIPLSDVTKIYDPRDFSTEELWLEYLARVSKTTWRSNTDECVKIANHLRDNGMIVREGDGTCPCLWIPDSDIQYMNVCEFQLNIEGGVFDFCIRYDVRCRKWTGYGWRTTNDLRARSSSKDTYNEAVECIVKTIENAVKNQQSLQAK